jgi:uncharacterized protein (TIRG00374 family)
LKGHLLNILKVILPLGIGVFVIWYQFNQLGAEQVEQIGISFSNANYLWVVVSVFFGLLSHVSRAYRWKFTLEPLGYKTSFSNNFFSVMIGYVANIILPRLGEVWRCIMLSRYEKLSFEKVFGTVVAERVADMLVLLLIISVVVLMELSRLQSAISELVNDYLTQHSLSDLIIKIGIVGVVLLIGAVVAWRFVTQSDHAVMGKVRGLLKGLFDGVLSIVHMKRKWAFLGHTVFIWIMYLCMFYLPFFALTETSDASISAVLASFVMASFSIVLVQGGIGVYPVAVAQTLVIYGIGYEAGLAMGWIIWVAQTVMIVLFGVASLILMPVLHKTKPELQ